MDNDEEYWQRQALHFKVEASRYRVTLGQIEREATLGIVQNKPTIARLNSIVSLVEKALDTEYGRPVEETRGL